MLGPGARGARPLCASGLRLMTSSRTSPASARSGTARQQSKSRVRTWLTCTVHSQGDRLSSAQPGLKGWKRWGFLNVGPAPAQTQGKSRLLAQRRKSFFWLGLIKEKVLGRCQYILCTPRTPASRSLFNTKEQIYTKPPA